MIHSAILTMLLSIASASPTYFLAQNISIGGKKVDTFTFISDDTLAVGDRDGRVTIFEFNGSQFIQTIQLNHQSSSFDLVGSDEEPKQIVCLQSPDALFRYEHTEDVFQYKDQLITSGITISNSSSTLMSSDGDYYFVADKTNGVHAFRFNGSTFTHFQTLAAADSPWVVALNPN